MQEDDIFQNPPELEMPVWELVETWKHQFDLIRPQLEPTEVYLFQEKLLELDSLNGISSATAEHGSILDQHLEIANAMQSNISRAIYQLWLADYPQFIPTQEKGLEIYHAWKKYVDNQRTLADQALELTLLYEASPSQLLFYELEEILADYFDIFPVPEIWALYSIEPDNKAADVFDEGDILNLVRITETIREMKEVPELQLIRQAFDDYLFECANLTEINNVAPEVVTWLFEYIAHSEGVSPQHKIALADHYLDQLENLREVFPLEEVDEEKAEAFEEISDFVYEFAVKVYGQTPRLDKVMDFIDNIYDLDTIEMCLPFLYSSYILCGKSSAFSEFEHELKDIFFEAITESGAEENLLPELQIEMIFAQAGIKAADNLAKQNIFIFHDPLIFDLFDHYVPLEMIEALQHPYYANHPVYINQLKSALREELEITAPDLRSDSQDRALYCETLEKIAKLKAYTGR